MDTEIRNRLRHSYDPIAYRAAIVARSRTGQCCNFMGFVGQTRCECGILPSDEELISYFCPGNVERIDEPLPETVIQAQRQKWLDIGFATGPSDRPLALAGIRLTYKAAELAPPPENLSGWTILVTGLLQQRN